jgi:chromosome segregation ATPase
MNVQNKGIYADGEHKIEKPVLSPAERSEKEAQLSLLETIQKERDHAKPNLIETELFLLIDRLKNELFTVRTELQDQARTSEENQKIMQIQKDNVIASLRHELSLAKMRLDEQVKEAEEIRTQNEILKERLVQVEKEQETVDKNWEFVEVAATALSDKIQGLEEIQTKLKRCVPSNAARS